MMEAATSVDMVLTSLQNIFEKQGVGKNHIVEKTGTFVNSLNDALKNDFIAILSTLVFRVNSLDHDLNERNLLFGIRIY